MIDEPAEHIYFDNLQIPEPSPHDKYPDYAKIRTPYSADNFKIFLDNAGLLDRYPELCFKLTHGFSLGDLEPVLESYSPPNLPSAKFHADVIREYIAEELRLGHLTGPYTKEKLEETVGLFRSSPFQVAVKPGTDGKPDKYRICRHLSYKGSLGRSVNDDIDPKEYPTRWGKATDMAKIVRLNYVPHVLLLSLLYSLSPFYRTRSCPFPSLTAKLSSKSVDVFVT
jgi:hypothetical protein